MGGLRIAFIDMEMGWPLKEAESNGHIDSDAIG